MYCDRRISICVCGTAAFLLTAGSQAPCPPLGREALAPHLHPSPPAPILEMVEKDVWDEAEARIGLKAGKQLANGEGTGPPKSSEHSEPLWL